MPDDIKIKKNVPKNDNGKTTWGAIFLTTIIVLIYGVLVWGLAYGNVEAYLDNVEIFPGVWFHFEEMFWFFFIASIPIAFGVFYLIFRKIQKK